MSSNAKSLFASWQNKLISVNYRVKLEVTDEDYKLVTQILSAKDDIMRKSKHGVIEIRIDTAYKIKYTVSLESIKRNEKDWWALWRALRNTPRKLQKATTKKEKCVL